MFKKYSTGGKESANKKEGNCERQDSKERASERNARRDKRYCENERGPGRSGLDSNDEKPTE